MGLERKALELSGQRFELGQLPGMRGLKMLNRLGRHFGGALTRVAAGDGAADAAAAVSDFFDKLPDAELEAITRELFWDCTVDGAALMPQFDLVMQGRTVDVLRLLKFAIEVNFGNFLEGRLAGLLAKAKASASKASST